MKHTEHFLPLLVVEDDSAIRELLEEELHDAGYTTHGVSSAEEAIALLSHTAVSLIITDVRLPGISGIQLLQQLRHEGSELGIIVITAFGTIDQAVEALKLGADDFLTKPLDLDAVRESVFRVLERQRMAVSQATEVGHFHGIMGKSDAMQALFHDASRLAKAMRLSCCWGKRHRQGAAGTGDSSGKPAPRRSVRGGKLRQHPRRPDGK